MSTVTERFKELYTALLASGRVKDYTDFAKQTGISRSMITEIFENRSGVGGRTIQKTVGKFTEVNSEWLVSGKGNMFFESRNEDDMGEDVPENDMLIYEGMRRANDDKLSYFDELNLVHMSRTSWLALVEKGPLDPNDEREARVRNSLEDVLLYIKLKKQYMKQGSLQ